jgi:preprotein translocase subunit SecD
MISFKKVFLNARVIILIIAVLLAIVAIHPVFEDGVAIRSVVQNSTAYEAGLRSPDGSVTPTQKEVVTQIDSTYIKNIEDYNAFMSKVPALTTIHIRTTKSLYSITVPQDKNIGLKVYDRPKNNLKKGLDISGGTRVLLQPDIPTSNNLTKEQRTEVFGITRDNIEKRLNVYGLTELTVKIITDKPTILGGVPSYISVEIAGADEEEVIGLLAGQGKFEATIINKTVFSGGERDIVHICKTAECSGLDPYQPCQITKLENGQDGSLCRFRFSISLSSVAAEKFADITKNLSVVTDPKSAEKRLSDNIIFYLDEKQTDSLTIDAGLKGRAATDIQITGSGVGRTETEAQQDALKRMKEMQSVLVSGSLPYKLKIVNTNLVSPTLGNNFLSNVLLIASIAIILVALAIFMRYREPMIFIPIIITLIAEIVLLLGMTALIGATLDIAAIAGIILTIGTGTNDQIIMIDEVTKNRHKKSQEQTSLLGSLKNAFFIIFSAYATIVVAMLPLLFAGAGLLKGFAITTILGASFGVFITRPAFGKVIETLLNK